MNGRAHGDGEFEAEMASRRVHPQMSFSETGEFPPSHCLSNNKELTGPVIEPSSFFGRLRKLYSDVVLKTQLEQLRQQGSYDAFKLGWHPVYEVRRLHGAKTRSDRVPPSLFWESDVGKWIEAACYFLASPDGAQSSNAAEYKACIQELIDMIEEAQQPDGYLNIYFTVVDKAGKFKNLRAMHEMYNSGHLLEAALAHHQLTGSRQFLDIMIRNIDCYIELFGPNENQLHGYPGHPELELAVLRLYARTKDPRHLAFGRYLVAERGQHRKDLNGETYFSWEARERDDEVFPATLSSIHDHTYNMSYAPLPEQKTIQGHSVRAMYLLTAAADLDDFASHAMRLWGDAVDHKMYLTGGLGTQPRTEGFHDIPYYLPQSTSEGGCYAETCASIGCMMVAERILSHGYSPKARDVLERCLYNNVIGGGSLNGKQFSYANKHATSGDETATRNDWFEGKCFQRGLRPLLTSVTVCCCPPNLSRTLGMLGGYTWSVKVDPVAKIIKLDVYILLSASRVIDLGGGEQAKVKMQSDMPWQGASRMSFSAPGGWRWDVKLPKPEYATEIRVDGEVVEDEGDSIITIGGARSIEYTFSMPVRLISPHPLSNQDNVSVVRGPVVYVAEAFDNQAVESKYPHFGGVGLSESATFTESITDIEGLAVVCLITGTSDVYGATAIDADEMYKTAVGQNHGREWASLNKSLVFVPWFARANRGGNGHVRVAMRRVPIQRSAHQQLNM